MITTSNFASKEPNEIVIATLLSDVNHGHVLLVVTGEPGAYSNTPIAPRVCPGVP